MARSSQMANWIFPTLYLLVTLGVAPSLGQPQWGQEDMTVKQGDTVTVSCSVDLGGDPFGVVRVIRKLDDSDNGITEVTITENDDVKDSFKDTGRYLAVFTNEGSATVELTFDGIRGEDAGRLGCLSIEDDQNIAYINIHVQVPVKEIHMVKIDNTNDVQASDGVTIHLREGEPLGVGCVVQMDGTMEYPEVSLLVNGEDHTNMFTPLEDSKKVPSDDGLPDTHTATVKYTYVTAKPTSAFNQKNLTCRAVAPGFDPREAWAFVDVQYKPVITCSKYENYAKLSESVTLDCDLRANPGADYQWFYGPEEDTATKIDTSNTELGISTLEKAYDEDKTTLSLAIQSTKEMHFTKYYIRANNDLGNSSAFLILHQGAEVITPAPTEPPRSREVQNPQSGSAQNNNSACVRQPSSVAAFLSVLALGVLSSWCLQH